MANSTLPAILTMNSLLALAQRDFKEVSFVTGTTFCWSPAVKQIIYNPKARGVAAVYSLLHELGHAQLQHKRYSLDFELLAIEVAAWEQAKKIASMYDTEIDEDHIQNCLDTYRDWLYRRSICPSCTTKTLQSDDTPSYVCFNCHATWEVAPSRFCRPYRKVKGQEPATVFAVTKG